MQDNKPTSTRSTSPEEQDGLSMKQLRAISQKSLREEQEPAEQKPENKPLLFPGPSEKGFLIGLYQEHLEEIGFLFTQCKIHIDDPDIQWPDLEEYEQRLAAHIDAIELGSELALNCVKQLLASSDKEELQAAVYTLATADGQNSMAEVIECMNKADPELVPCFIAPLKHTPYIDTSQDLSPTFSHQRPEIRAAAIEITAYRGESKADKLTPLLDDEHPLVATALVVAMARLKQPEASSVLERYLTLQDDKLQRKATLSLLKMGMQNGVQHVYNLCKSKNPIAWALDYLALCGNPNDLKILEQIKEDQDCQISALTAMGALGNIQAVETLILALGNQSDEIKLAASEALHRLTGAELREIKEVELETDPDELLEGEEMPEPTKMEIEQVCTSQAEWTTWWNQNRARFRPEVCFRYGIPYHFGQCIEEIAAEQSKMRDRQRAYLELVIRAGLEEPFELDWPVQRQRETIRRLQAWWRGSKNRFSPGIWYFRANML